MAAAAAGAPSSATTMAAAATGAPSSAATMAAAATGAPSTASTAAPSSAATMAAAAAGAPSTASEVGVADHKPTSHEAFNVVDLRPFDEWSALLVDQYLYGVGVDDEIIFSGFFLNAEGVLEITVLSRGDHHPQKCRVASLFLDDSLEFLGGLGSDLNLRGGRQCDTSIEDGLMYASSELLCGDRSIVNTLSQGR